jgi:hypothetical protein
MLFIVFLFLLLQRKQESELKNNQLREFYLLTSSINHKDIFPMSYKECMLQEIGTYFINRSVKRIIFEIRKKPIDTTLFSENCDLLDNMWEEVCVQAQEDMGWAWSAYDYQVKDLCETIIKALPQPLHITLTSHVCRKYDLNYQPGAISLELVSDEVKERIYAIAYKFSNKRIEQFVALNYPDREC